MATAKKRGPTWAQKKKQIAAALKRVAAASAALKAAQKDLAKVLASDPGTGPNPWN